MNKDQVFQENSEWVECIQDDVLLKSGAESAMDEWAEIQSVSFAEWIIKNERFLPMLSQPIPELYNLYKQSVKP